MRVFTLKWKLDKPLSFFKCWTSRRLDFWSIFSLVSSYSWTRSRGVLLTNIGTDNASLAFDSSVRSSKTAMTVGTGVGSLRPKFRPSMSISNSPAGNRRKVRKSWAIAPMLINWWPIASIVASKLVERTCGFKAVIRHVLFIAETTWLSSFKRVLLLLKWNRKSVMIWFIILNHNSAWVGWVFIAKLKRVWTVFCLWLFSPDMRCPVSGVPRQ